MKNSIEKARFCAKFFLVCGFLIARAGCVIIAAGAFVFAVVAS